MPEPVVIIGPAAGPAGHRSGARRYAGNGDGGREPKRPLQIRAACASARGSGCARAFKLAAGFFLSITNRVVWGFVRVITLVIRNYPRHSLAAGASLVILGGILYSQSGSRTPGRDVTNAIKGNGSAAG